jgi:23S rRNA (uracil1939-C5)-methyltransferase
MAIIEEGTCTIERINHKGLGVCSSNGKDVEIPYVLPGEEVSFSRHSYKGKSNCTLNEIIQKSPERIEPACKYFGICGGCLLQQFSKPNYESIKLQMLTKHLEDAQITTKINQIISIAPGNRRRAVFEAIKKDTHLAMGFHKFHSNQIINLDSCPALLPELSNIIEPLKQMLGNILQLKQKAQIFLTMASNGIDITLEIYKQPRLSDEQRQQLSIFASSHNLVKLIFRAKKFTEIIHKIADPYVLFDQTPVEIDAHGFLQASFASDQILSDIVLKYASLLEEKSKVVDLFCGRGTLTLPLSQKFMLDAFESDAKALAALTKAQMQANRQINVHKVDLFQNPLTSKELGNYELAVINPPRAGAKAQILQLSNSKIKTIIYISCNPQTFSQDAKILIDGGYKLVEVTPLDQFYWSGHLEVIGLFVAEPLKF